jgi:hypothetical protein
MKSKISLKDIQWSQWMIEGPLPQPTVYYGTVFVGGKKIRASVTAESSPAPSAKIKNEILRLLEKETTSD